MAFASLLDRLPPRLDPGPPAHLPVAEWQSGAIPYSLIDSVPVFLLITSRRTGRWIYPKGRLADGLKPWDSAAREALSEAGVEGRIDTEPVGSYRSWKLRGVRRFVIEAHLYPLLVERQLDKWPHRGKRHRHWATLAEARRLLTQKGLIALTETLAARTAGTSAPPVYQVIVNRIAQ